MKLRILGNSVRMRVTQTELTQIAAGEPVREAVDFGGGRLFKYRLKSDGGARQPKADYAENTLTITLPATQVSEWANSDMVSIRAEQAVDGGSELKILVEKDFACLQPREGEDESDMFPHPEEAKTC